MAKANYNGMLEYAPNVLEFWMFDENDVAINFDSELRYSITRIDDSTKTYSVLGVVSGNHVTFNVNPPKETLYKAGDKLFSYDEPVYEHIYSVKSPNRVYIGGKLNMIQVG